MIKAILFDTIGTTVKTENPGIIIDAFLKAFGDHGIEADRSFLVQQRGKNKSDVIRQVLEIKNCGFSFEDKILETFNSNIGSALNDFKEADGLDETFSFLRSKNIYVGIGTGLSEEIFYQLQQRLNWERHQLDYIGISEIIGKSRPDPAMIFEMMEKLNIDSSHEILKVGDTVADIQEGKNAGSFTAVILAGTQPETMLLNESPDFVLKGLRDILKLPIF